MQKKKKDTEGQTKTKFYENSPPLQKCSWGTNFFYSESVASCWGLIFAIFWRSCPRNTKHEFRWRTRSDHVTRNALAARNNAAYGQGNGRQSFRTVFRYH